MRDKFRVNSMIVVPAAIIVLGIYIFQGLSITAPTQTQTIEWIKVIPYIIVLGTAIAGMNVMLVLIIGILTSGIIGIATGSFGIFDWFGAMGTGITGMGELIIITLLAGGCSKPSVITVVSISLSGNSPATSMVKEEPN